jgi:hypothetical protein
MLMLMLMLIYSFLEKKKIKKLNNLGFFLLQEEYIQYVCMDIQYVWGWAFETHGCVGGWIREISF